MTFLAGEALHDAVLRIASGSQVRCAVAFWGDGAEDLFPDQGRNDFRIICNLKLGGTNPHVISKLERKGAVIRQHDRLHAKVYLGDGQAVVASANASTNGLGLEGVEQRGWNEAGVELTDVGDVGEWFEALWRRSREITPADLRAAVLAWNRRRSGRPTVSFADFHTEATTLPLVAWSGNVDWDVCEESVEEQVGYYNEEIEERLGNGVDVEGPDDAKLLRPGTWVLCWQRTNRGVVHRRSKPWWTCAGPLIRGAYNYQVDGGKPRDVVIRAEQMPPDPFNAAEPLFVAAFREVIGRDTYDGLRADDYKGDFFAPRLELTRQFWRELKQEYDRLASSVQGPEIA